MMTEVPNDQLEVLAPTLSRDLERGRIIYFPTCPIPLPSDDDQRFLRESLASHLAGKNVSHYREGDRLVGVNGDEAVRTRARSILTTHAREVEELLGRLMPDFMRGARLGISSFRPLQEKGRDLSTHASNELLHVDAGAYGATHGDRILRFFVNINPVEDRVWISRGSFAELYRRYAGEAGIPSVKRSLSPGLAERAWSGLLQAGAGALPPLRMIDTSPYDRLMRQFHNFMKDTPAFQTSTEGREEFVFKPFSAWMVLTDAVSHACVSGQHALVDTFLIPLANCRELDQTPLHILAGTAAIPAAA
jgi:hypothetical protein